MLSEDIKQGATKLKIGSRGDLKVGGSIVLGDGTKKDYAVVKEITDDFIVLAEPLEHSHKAGTEILKTEACTVTQHRNSAGVCTDCPKGYSCDGKKATKCKVTEYPKDNKCIICPSGFTCNGESAPVKCDSSKYVSNNKCLSCPSGLSCNGAIACKVTEYPKDNKCTICPSGFTCNGKSAPTQCDSSKYVSNNKCLPCPSGFTCNGKSAPVKCDSSKYVSNNKCLPCPSGKSCNGATALEPCNRDTSRSISWNKVTNSACRNKQDNAYITGWQISTTQRKISPAECMSICNQYECCLGVRSNVNQGNVCMLLGTPTWYSSEGPVKHANIETGRKWEALYKNGWDEPKNWIARFGSRAGSYQCWSKYPL